MKKATTFNSKQVESTLIRQLKDVKGVSLVKLSASLPYLVAPWGSVKVQLLQETPKLIMLSSEFSESVEVRGSIFNQSMVHDYIIIIVSIVDT